jgi:hypothetical protein
MTAQLAAPATMPSGTTHSFFTSDFFNASPLGWALLSASAVSPARTPCRQPVRDTTQTPAAVVSAAAVVSGVKVVSQRGAVVSGAR